LQRREPQHARTKSAGKCGQIYGGQLLNAGVLWISLNDTCNHLIFKYYFFLSSTHRTPTEHQRLLLIAPNEKERSSASGAAQRRRAVDTLAISDRFDRLNLTHGGNT
jgi:hypothetical protein